MRRAESARAALGVASGSTNGTVQDRLDRLSKRPPSDEKT